MKMYFLCISLLMMIFRHLHEVFFYIKIFKIPDDPISNILNKIGVYLDIFLLLFYVR